MRECTCTHFHVIGTAYCNLSIARIGILSLLPFPSFLFPPSSLFPPSFSLPPFPPSSSLPPFFSLPPFSLLSPSFLPPHRRSRTPISFLPTPCHSLIQYLSPNYLTRPLKYSLLLLRTDTRANLPERLLSNRSCRRKRSSAWILPKIYIT